MAPTQPPIRLMPAAQAVKTGLTERPLMVRVAAPDGALMVGEISKPLVVEVTAAVVASVKVRLAKLPVSAP